jgi:hypothetical protein
MSERPTSLRWMLPALVILLSCSPTGTTGPDTSRISLPPAWISASWGGNAVEPTDRTDRAPKEFRGQRCPTGSVRLENYTSPANAPPQARGPGLLVWNNCSITNSVGICARKGSLPQPAGNFALRACATDPLLTPFLDLKVLTLVTGRTPGIYIETAGAPSVEVFYCGTDTWLLGPPAADKVSCVMFPKPLAQSGPE